MAESSFDDTPHLTETQARQGFRGRHVLWMLIISVTLAVIALAATWGYHARDLAAADAGRANRIAASQPAPTPLARPQPAAQP